MEKTFLLYLSVHWGDLIEQLKRNLSYTLKERGKRANFRLQNSRIFSERERRTIFERKAGASEKTARENGERR